MRKQIIALSLIVVAASGVLITLWHNTLLTSDSFVIWLITAIFFSCLDLFCAVLMITLPSHFINELYDWLKIHKPRQMKTLKSNMVSNTIGATIANFIYGFPALNAAINILHRPERLQQSPLEILYHLPKIVYGTSTLRVGTLFSILLIIWSVNNLYKLTTKNNKE